MRSTSLGRPAPRPKTPADDGDDGEPGDENDEDCGDDD